MWARGVDRFLPGFVTSYAFLVFYILAKRNPDSHPEWSGEGSLSFRMDIYLAWHWSESVKKSLKSDKLVTWEEKDKLEYSKLMSIF